MNNESILKAIHEKVSAHLTNAIRLLAPVVATSPEMEEEIRSNAEALARVAHDIAATTAGYLDTQIAISSAVTPPDAVNAMVAALWPLMIGICLANCRSDGRGLSDFDWLTLREAARPYYDLTIEWGRVTGDLPSLN